jgi:hypothetical protein
MRKAQFPEQPVTIFLNLKRCGWVEYRFTDPDNYGSEWTYYFYYTFPFATYPFSAGPLISQYLADQRPRPHRTSGRYVSRASGSSGVFQCTGFVVSHPRDIGIY